MGSDDRGETTGSDDSRGDTGPGERLVDPGEGDADGADGDAPTAGDGRTRRVVHGLVAVAVTVLSMVVALVGSVPGYLLGIDTPTGFAIALVGNELGFAVVGVGFVLATGRGLAYLDLELPGFPGGWAVVAAFTVGAFVLRSGILLATFELGIDPAPSTVAQVDLPPAVLAGILLPAMLLVVGPAEELLFRGVLQKFLREELSPLAAILVAGLLFGAIHVLSLVQSTGVGTLVSLVVITAVGLGLGWLYEYTGSLPAAMLAHGGYNALIVATAFGLQALG